MPHSSHSLPPGQKAFQLDIPLVLPGAGRRDECDACVGRLRDRLRGLTGVAEAHVQEDGGHPYLCLHYDPNLLPLEKLERLAKDEGAQIARRYCHDTLPIAGMDCASCAGAIEHVVRKQPGVLQANVNYPTGKMKVEYDATVTSRENIAKTVGKLGYRIPSPKAIGLAVLNNATGAVGSLTGHPQAGGHVHGPGCDHGDPGHAGQGHVHHHDHEHGQAHGHADASTSHLPHWHLPGGAWWAGHTELGLAILSGVFLTIGYAGEHLLRLPPAFGLALYVAAYIAGGFNLTRHAIPAMLHGRFDVDFLMLAGAVGAAILGHWPEGAFLLFLFSLGHALEHSAMERARDAINALGKLTPKVALVRRNGQEVQVPVEALQLDDLAIVRPGERVAVDGVIVAGRSAIDQSPITGESVPVEKDAGEQVFAGSINGDGALEVRVTKLASDTTMARVMQMVEEAQSQKSPTQTFAENFERVFVPLILGVVTLAAIIPPLVGWLPWRESIMHALSALVAASPCALALATPAAVLAGIGQAARNGVLIKGGVHLENLGSLNAIAFDKTGTLTRGRPEVTDIVTAPGVGESELLTVAAAVETRSTHPLAQAVVRRATAAGLPLPAAGDLQNLPGRGVQAELNGQLVRIGNLRLFQENGVDIPEELRQAVTQLGSTGKPSMIVGHGSRVLGVLGLADPIRPETKKALLNLRRAGIEHLIMLTGDNERVAHNVAEQAGVTQVRADLLPEHKVDQVKDLLRTHQRVAMVGDGVNDAPALANATVGIAMGAGGTDVALETADVALMGDDLAKLAFAVELSRQSRAIIRQNLFIALGVIALLVPCTLLGYARLGIAVVFHEGSTIVVVANALRLLSFRPRHN